MSAGEPYSIHNHWFKAADPHVFYDPAEGHCNRVYMGQEAYEAITSLHLREANSLTANAPTFLHGMPIVVLSHLPPMAVICHHNIRPIVERIEKEAMHNRMDRAMWFKDQQRSNQPQATSIYRLEEPNRILLMVLVGFVITAVAACSWLSWLIFGR